eukprot:261521-Pleurochrysis_carterae.AAC.1
MRVAETAGAHLVARAVKSLALVQHIRSVRVAAPGWHRAILVAWTAERVGFAHCSAWSVRHSAPVAGVRFAYWRCA